MLGQPDHQQILVACDRFECDRVITVAVGPALAIRRAILDANWLINLVSESKEILVGQEDQIEFGLSPKMLLRYLRDPDFALGNDQQYCSLDCAGKDA